jgi:L-ascorbate metabolism protein UlaG (beta-lactamase superfamily)
MRVRRLTWAGVEIQGSGATVLIDLLARVPELAEYGGEPVEEFVAPAAEAGTVPVAAVTHLHSDHFDAESLHEALAPNASVLCPVGTEEQIRDSGLEARGVAPWETVTFDGLGFTAVPAVDGFGDVQVSWVVSDGDRRMIHCGDTLWHGYWWEIAKRSGPIDLAFLPINGAIADFDYLQPASGMPAILTPEQAASAALVLGAQAAAPHHYGTFHKPPTYVSLPDPEGAFVAAAERRGVATRVLRPGEEIELSPTAQG